MFDHSPSIYLAAAAIFIGFIGLVWSADRFVAGAAAFASNFGVSKMIIGLTIVSFGTSAPEILVSLNASLADAGDIAIGNALGSNIANIGLVLAITTLIASIPVKRSLLRYDMPILLLVTAVAGVFLYDAKFSRGEGLALAALLVPVLWIIVKTKGQDLTAEAEDEGANMMSTASATLWFLLGLGTLIASSKILVWGAQTSAEFFGVSPLIIGLTIIAIGTSLPELAASVASALKGHHDIALGNIIGSNIFNILAVMSIAGVISPLEMSTKVFYRDYFAVALLTLALLLCIVLALITAKKQALLGRTMGIILLASYAAYIYVLSTEASL